VFTANCSKQRKQLRNIKVVSTLWAVDDLATALCGILYYQKKQNNSRSQALRKAQFKLRDLTGDDWYGKYKRQLEDYFEEQKGEQQKLSKMCGD
jgi:CHAT domain-containing protein